MHQFIALFLLFLLGGMTPGFAADFNSPRTEALGGAGHASPLLSDALYLNPSFSSFVKTHAFSSNYEAYGNGNVFSPAGGNADNYGHLFNISVLDGTPESLFQAGVGYTRREDASFVHLGAGKSFLTKFGAGIGGKFIFSNDGGGTRIGETTLSMSGLFASWIQTSFIVDNLLETATRFGLYREYTLGIKLNLDSIVLIYIDPNWVPSLPEGQATWGIQAGIEFPFMNDLFLRTGYYRNSMIPALARRGDGYGVGFGWLAPKLSIDYSFSRITSPLFSYVHNFGFSIYF